MKIAFITTTFENTTNGPAKFAWLLHKYCISKKKEVVFFTEDIQSASKSVIKINIPRWLDKPGIGFLYRSFKYYFAVKNIPSIDIVVSNNTMYNFLFNLATSKKCIGFINDNEHLNKKISLSYTYVRSYIFSLLERYNLFHNSITIANSKFLKNEIEQRLKGRINLEVLYKGIQTNEILDITKHDNDKKIKILFVKTNYNAGGLSTLLEALEDFDNIHLNIVTSKKITTEPIHSFLNKAKYSYNLYHKLDQENVFALMKESHCLCIPSNIEALGVANMEGMLHSCLIISTNVGGIPEVLDNGRVGIMVNPNDSEKLREKIRFIQNNREFRKSMVKNAHQFVQNFSIDNTLTRFFDITNA